MADEKIKVALVLEDKFSKTAGAKFKSLKTGALALGAVVTGATVALGKLVNKVADYNDTIGKAVPITGLASEELSGLAYAMDLAGGSTDGTIKAMRQFARVTGQAEDGLTTATRSFEALGVSIKDAQGNTKTQAELLDEVADSLANMEDGANKTLVAQELFSKGASAMLNATRNGAQGLREMAEEARVFGLTVTSNSAFVSAEFNDMKTRLESGIFGTFKRFTDQILPTVTAGLEVLKDTLFDLGKNGGGDIDAVVDAINENLLPVLVNGIYYTKVIWSTFKLFGSYLDVGFTTIVEGAILTFNQLLESLKFGAQILENFGRAVTQVISGDFDKAKTTVSSMGTAFDTMTDNMSKNAQVFQENMTPALIEADDAMNNFVGDIVNGSAKAQKALEKAKKSVTDLKDGTLATGGTGTDTTADDATVAVDPRIAKEAQVIEALKAQRVEYDRFTLEQDDFEIKQLEEKYRVLIELTGQNEQLKNDVIMARDQDRTILEKEQSDRRIEIAQKESEAKLEASSMFFSGFAKLTALGAKRNKALAIASKASAISEATVQMYLGANRALGAFPPPFGAIAAAGVIAGGTANIAGIASQKFNNGGIVQGESTSGDRVLVRANAGEMVLTKGQQKSLYNNIDNGTPASQTAPITYSPNITVTGDSDTPVLQRILAESKQEFQQFVMSTMSRGQLGY